MDSQKLCTRCALLFTLFFLTSFGSWVNFAPLCCTDVQLFENNTELQSNANTEIPREEKLKQKFVTKFVTLKSGKIGITFNKSGRIINMEEDAQPSILDTLKIPGWNITKIGSNKFSEKLFIDKSNGSEEYEITVEREEKTFCCDICFDDYSEFEFNKYTNPRCRHSCCLKCFFNNWSIGINGRKCHLCREDLEHALFVSVYSLNLQHVKTVITEGNKNFGIEISIIGAATRIWPQSHPITKLLHTEFIEQKNIMRFFTLLELHSRVSNIHIVNLL